VSGGVDLDFGEEAPGGDAVAGGLGGGDAAHDSGASAVKAAWAVVEVPAQAPNLRAAEEGIKDQARGK